MTRERMRVNLGVETYRHLVRTYEVLTARWLVATFIVVFLCAALVFATVLYMGGLQPRLEALGFLLISVAAGMLLALTYGWTYYLNRTPDVTVPQLAGKEGKAVSIADAADIHLLWLLAKHVYRYDAAEMKALVSALVERGHVKEAIERLMLDSNKLVQAICKLVVPSLSWEQLSSLVLQQAMAHNREVFSILDVFGVLIRHSGMRTFLRQHELREQDIDFILFWAYHRMDIQHAKRRWWDPDNMFDFMGVGLSWASGYTPFVDRFIRMPQGNIWDTPFGHEDQVEQLINSLARQRQSNVLIVGQPGVGRLGVVKELAHRVVRGQAHPELNGKRVAYINLAQLMSLAGSGAQQLGFVSKALSEMERAGNMIVVLDGIANIIGGELGQIDISEILLPFFSSQTVRVVVVMSTDEYHSRLENNDELMQLFEIVQVPALDKESTLELLAIAAPVIERRAGVFIPYQTLRELVESTSTILPHIPFPEKVFDMLEEVIVEVQERESNVITSDDVHTIIARKIGVDLGRIEEGEREHLLSLEDVLHRRVVNQEEGIAAIAHAMIRSRAGVRSQDRPIGTFLFLGPTGVGKTETAKALAHAYFGSEDYLQRLDMSEFQREDGLALLIGDDDRPTGRLTTIVSDHPFSVLLLDEFEKASHLVQQIFLPVFDEGYLTDARGRKYAFTHMIIIATSNAAAEFIRTNVRDDGTLPEDFDKRLREYVLKEGIFLPEVLNRFDGVITYKPLTQQHVRKIAQLMIRSLNKRLDTEHGTTVAVTDELLGFLVQYGYDPEFGARPMARLIQKTIEYAVAEQIVRGTVEPGQQITLAPQQLRALQQTA